MVLTNLDQSGFRKLNLIKPACDPPTADGGTGRDNGNRNPDLVMLLEQYFHKIVDKSVEPNKIDVCQLLAQPSFGMSIYKFISKQERKCSDSKKSAAKSATYRTWGNKDYLRGRFSSAAYYYTMAIIYAPDVPEKVDGNDNVDDKKVPEELSLAYGNRSAVFYELGQYEAALTDIDHSLATGYPREKLPKLLLRKVECFISLKHLRDAKRVLEHLCTISGSELKDYDDQVLKIRFQLLGVDSNDECDLQKRAQSAVDPLLAVLNYLNRTGRYQPSTDFASMSFKVEPKFSEAKSKGRHLVAKQDIEPGDILMVESPFVSVLNKHFEFHFCHHCCRQLESKIGESEFCITGSVVPCTECTHVLYCSANCRTKAWRTFHQFECSILPVLHEMDQASHLSLRMLLTTGLDVFQQVCDRNSQTEDESKDPLSSLKIGDSAEIAAPYELVYQLSDQQDDHLPEFVIYSAVLLQLTKKSDFVRTAEQEKLASSILLRQLLQFYANSFNITGFEFSGPDKSHDFALGLYPTLSSLMNHSCEHNSEITFVQSTELILRATKRISIGSQVTSSYGHGSCLHQEFSERRKIILENWGFHCECTRCVREARDGLNGKYFPIGCKVCGSTLTRTSSSSDTFNCSNSSCAAFSMSLSEAQQLYARIESRLAIAENRILSYEKSPNPEPNFALHKCELDLSELSNIPGLRNFWKLAGLHRRLSLALGPMPMADIRRHFARFCEISEANSGIVNAVPNYENLIDLYRKLHVYGDEEGTVIEQYRRIGKRLIELVRLTLIADVEPPTDGPDLLENESRDLRKLYRDMVEILNRLPKEE